MAAFHASGGVCPACRDAAHLACPECARGQALADRLAQEECARAERAIIDASGIPPRLAGATFATYRQRAGHDAAALAAVQVGAAQWRGRHGLILYGPQGVGKSGLAAALLVALAGWYAQRQRGARFHWALVSDLLDILRLGAWDATAAARLAAAKEADVLVLDDLGAEPAGDRLLSIVATRYDALRPTIATTNLDLGTAAGLSELSRRIGARVAERLLDQAGATIEVRGANLRANREGGEA